MIKDVKKIISRILPLLEEAESYEFHKQNLIKSSDKLFTEYQQGMYSHAEYTRLLQDLLKKRTKKEWMDYYDAYIFSILKQIEPMISQVIYYLYNDDMVRKLSVSREAQSRAEEKQARAVMPALEEDKKHVLRKIKDKDAKEFLEFEKEQLTSKQVSPLRERYEEEITKVRKARENVRPGEIEINTPVLKTGRSSFFQKLRYDMQAYIEKRRLKARKKHIARELEKSKKPSLFSILHRKLLMLKPQPRPKPVRIKKQSLFAKFADAIASKFRPRPKLELREPLKKPAEQKSMPIIPAQKEAFLPKKDQSLDRLFAQLDTINKVKPELKVSEPKRSLRMNLDLFMIRLHMAIKHRNIGLIAMPAKVYGKPKPGVKPAVKPEVKIKVPEARAPAPEKMTWKVTALLHQISAFAEKARAYLFVPVEAPKGEGEKAARKIAVPAAKPAQPEAITLLERMKAFASKLGQRMISVLPRAKPEAKPARAMPEEKPAREEKPAPEVRFRFSWSSIKESYNKMMEREKIFVSKKISYTPSLQMQTIREKVSEMAEEEAITPKLLKEEVESIQRIIAEKKKYKVYQPSFIGSFANATIRKFTFYLIERYPSFFKTLYDNLRLANIKVLSNTYVNIMLLTTIIVSALSSIFFFAFFLFTNNPIFMVVPKTLMMVMLAGGVTFLLFYTYPQMQAKNRERSINTNLPFAINHISAVAGSGVPPTKMFKLIMESEEYGEIAVEIEKIVEYVELFGYDLLTAVRSVAFTTPSSIFKEFLEGMVSTIESGGDLNVYLKAKTSEAMLSYELERQKYTENISTYSDIYTGILIAAPLFFIVALSLVSMLGGTIGGLEVNVVIVGGAYVVIPALNIIFLIILGLTQPEV